MADIYRGSTCNIAAIRALNANEDCLYDKSLAQLCIVKPAWGNYLSECVFHNKEIWNGIFWSLWQRVWVVRELLLPHRIFHLRKSEFSWEYLYYYCLREYPRGFPSTLSQSFKKTPLDNANLDIGVAKQGSDLPWGQIVHNYTMCSLTRTEDKSVALSGIIKITQEAFGIENTAGLWRGTLETQLLWRSAWDQRDPLLPAIDYHASSCF